MRKTANVKRLLLLLAFSANWRRTCFNPVGKNVITAGNGSQIRLLFPSPCSSMTNARFFVSRIGGLKTYVNASTASPGNDADQTYQGDFIFKINATTAGRFAPGSKVMCGVEIDGEVIVSATLVLMPANATDIKVTDNQSKDVAAQQCIVMKNHQTGTTDSPVPVRHGAPICCYYSCLSNCRIWKWKDSATAPFSENRPYIYRSTNEKPEPGYSVEMNGNGSLVLTVLNLTGVGETYIFGVELTNYLLETRVNVTRHRVVVVDSTNRSTTQSVNTVQDTPADVNTPNGTNSTLSDDNDKITTHMIIWCVPAALFAVVCVVILSVICRKYCKPCAPSTLKEIPSSGCSDELTPINLIESNL